MSLDWNTVYTFEVGKTVQSANIIQVFNDYVRRTVVSKVPG
jgi:hypothetical protein